MRPLNIIAHSRPVTCVKYNSTGDLVFSSGIDGAVNVWDPADGRQLGTYTLSLDDEQVGGVVWSFDITHDGTRLCIGSARGAFVVDVETGTQLAGISTDAATCRSVAWSSKPVDEDTFVAARDPFAGRIPMAIIIYKRVSKESGKEEYEVKHEITDFDSKCTGVAFGPFDETVLARHENGTLSVWDVETGKLIKTVNAHKESITNWDFSRDKAVLVTVSRDKTAKMWALPDVELIQEYVTDRPLNACALSPLFDNEESPRRHMVVGGGQKSDEVTTTKANASQSETLLVHLETAQVLGQISGHFSPTRHLCFCPDGKGFVTGAEEGNVNIWRFDKSYFNPKKF